MVEENQKLQYHTDRTRIITYQSCHRKRFWSTELAIPDTQGTLGVAPKLENLAMLVGSSVHEGLEHLHQFEAQHPEAGTDEDNRAYAVKLALDYYNGKVLVQEQAALDDLNLADDEASEDWLNLSPGQENKSALKEFKIKEARALVEALVRAYYEVGLAQLLEKYDILLVEHEIASVIAETPELEVIMHFRPDAIMREKSTGNLAALSIKTIKKLDARQGKNWIEDDQGISECFGIREMVREGKLEEFGYEPFSDPQIGVQMLYLLKGYESQDEWDGIWKHNSPLIRHYFQEQPNGDELYQPKWKYIGDDGKPHTLGKAWKLKQIWDLQHSIGEWIAELKSEWREVLDAQVVFSPLYIRSDEEMDNWMLEAGLQELNLAQLRADMNSAHDGLNLEMILAGEFPKRRAACNYPGPCEFKPLCHPVVEMGMSPVGAALLQGGLVQIEGFTQRKPNHPGEEVS
jgi:hypothetical protein